MGARLQTPALRLPTAASGCTTCTTAPASKSATPATSLRRRSQVLAQRRIHLLHPQSQPGRACDLQAIPRSPTVVVAPAPNETILNGEVDWVYEEELDVRSNYFWSPDSKNLAFLQMNEAEVPLYPITDWIPTHATVVLAALSAARRSQSQCPRRRGRRTGRHDVSWIKLPIQPRPGLHSPLRLGRPQNPLDRNPHPRSQAPRPLLRRAANGQCAIGARRSPTKNSSTKTTMSIRRRRQHRSHQLERWPQSHLSLQLRHSAIPHGTVAKLEKPADQGRL